VTAAALRAEILKLRTTKTILGLIGTMVGLVLLIVLLHLLTSKGLPTRSRELSILMEGGVVLGSTFAALVGAMSITSEIRYGTIRPTFLGIPQRGRVIAAKAITSIAAGLLTGLVAAALAVAVGAIAITARGDSMQLSGADYARLIAGGAGAAALLAGIGLGVGAVVRNQVGAIIGLFIWLEIVENVIGDSAPSVARYLPGDLARGIAGQQAGTLHPLPLPVSLLLLIAYAATAAGIGWRATTRRDFA
jgi:ABC-type transport system involved in multi-copper enzyme maturation permease subunit